MEIKKLKQYREAEYPERKFYKPDLSVLSKALKFTPAGLVPLILASCFPTAGLPPEPYDNNVTMENPTEGLLGVESGSVDNYKTEQQKRYIITPSGEKIRINVREKIKGPHYLQNKTVLGHADSDLEIQAETKQKAERLFVDKKDYQKEKEHIAFFLSCLKSIGLI